MAEMQMVKVGPAEISYTYDEGRQLATCLIHSLDAEQAREVRRFLKAAEEEGGWEALPKGLPYRVESEGTSLSLEQIKIAVGQGLTPRPLGV